MKFYMLIILCILQGLTEFLPISSSGHLLLAEKIFKIQDNILLINLFLHLATLFAVIIVYRKTIWKLIKKPFQPLTSKLFIATNATVLLASVYEIFELNKVFDRFFGFYFIITAFLLFVTYEFQKRATTIKVGEISYKNSILVGLVQGFAVLPGISRSGSTISSLVLSGNDEASASEFSFLLSIPIIVGGFVIELLKVDDFGEIFGEINYFQIIIAFLLTFVIAIISIKLTVKMLKNNKFIYFSIYLFLLGIATLIFL